MSLWTPTFVIGGCLVLAAVLHLVAAYMSRRGKSQVKSKGTELEILTPFDGEQIGLYETVRGRVFPPDQKLQVLVFAGDKRWYTQPSVDVKGSAWSVKCQFGSLDSPGGGAYKIVAFLGNELKEGMWYSELPTGIPKSNIISVHRPEVTIEQKLSAALREAKEANLRAKDQEHQKDGLYKLYKESEAQLATLTWLKRLAEEQAKDISEHVKATIATYPHAGELVLDGIELCIVLGLSIRNESIFDISINPKDVSGHLSINGKAFKEPAGVLIREFDEPIEDLRPMQRKMLVLEQPLRASEAETVKKCLTDNGSTIWIGGLNVLVSVTSTSVPVIPKPLRLNHEGGKVLLSTFKCNTENA